MMVEISGVTTSKESSNIYKYIEKERCNFDCSGIDFMGEKLPHEEGRKLYWLDIEKECSLRRKMNVVAIWLSENVTSSFEEIKKIIDR